MTEAPKNPTSPEGKDRAPEVGGVIVCSCVDKQGVPFEVGACPEDDEQCMLDMYDCFTPKGCSQGLPPVAEGPRRDWVNRLYREGINFLARCDGRVVGHAGLLPDLARKEAEFLIFIDQGYRNRGLGTQLMGLVLDKARMMGLTRIWLSVEAYNFRAIAVYKKFGFEFCEACEDERIMNLDLDRVAGKPAPEVCRGS